MGKFPQGFMVGASTAAHQVEGNNVHSDYWLQENVEHSQFVEPSGKAVDHYHRYEEDIRLMAEAGLNASNGQESSQDKESSMKMRLSITEK